VILYLDTSSLIKLYVAEAGSEEVRDLVDRASVVSTSVVAFPETRSAFARLGREGTLTPEQLASVRSGFLRDWDSFLKIRVLTGVSARAGALTEVHALRGFDAIHLASFLEVLGQADGEEVEFSAFDARLAAAARAVAAQRAS
jgi:predicted nucleic acid-binding protein